MQCVPVGVQSLGENDHLHGAGQVLHAGEGHHRVGFGGHHAVFDHRTYDAHTLAILYVGVLAGQRLDGVRGNARGLFPVGVQRMTGQIESADLFFLLEQLLAAVLLQLPDLVGVRRCRIRRSPAHHREQVQLTVQIPAGVGLDALQDAFHGFYMAVAVVAHAVERTGFDETFHRPAV